ncbi:MAG: Rne/Rng family ribonuclease [Acidobacteriota bacterium]
MSKELVISSNRHETKVAILEDDQLVELYFQRANEYSLAGSIHKGRVTRVLPGMQSAFVDVGLERDAFLYVSDFFEEHHDDLDKVGGDEPRPERDRSGGFRRDRDRDRDRDRERRPVAPVAALPVAGEETAEAVAASEGDGEAPGTEAVTAAPEDGRRGDRDRDRGRGRRGRRRGRRERGSGNLPESKYASADETAPADDLADEEPEEIEEAASAPAAATGSIWAPSLAEPIVLPGESLAKYRRPQPVRPPVQNHEAVVEPVAAKLENEAVVEQVLAQVEAVTAPEPPPIVAAPEPEPESTPEPPPFVAAVVAVSEPAPEPAAPIETAHSLEEDLEADEDAAIDEARHELDEDADEEEDELDAAQAAAEAALAAEEAQGDQGETGEEEAGQDEAEQEEAGQEQDGSEGPEPARQPQSLTAALRDRDRNSRFQARGRRSRGRRRGPRERGNEIEDPNAPAPAAEAAAPTEARERPERSDRERSDRDRSDRPERSERSDRGERTDRERRERPPLPQITDLLKPGQEILVQISKEPIAAKGARITSHIALPGRFCVYMPTTDHNGVSRKISSDEERIRLKRILQTHRTGMPGGFIIRTAGEGQSEEELAADMNFLYNLWLDIRSKAEKKAAPLLVHHDLDIVQRTLRDQLTTDYKTIWLDNEDLYESTVNFVQRFQPALVNKVKLWTRPVPIFDTFNITAELEKALRPKVWLKSGGYIVINQTEALVAIDINTGKYVGKSNRLEDTIVKTNTEAVKEIVRQIRLRDLGGIIVVDFIDMDERKNRQKVMQALEEAMRVDRAPYKILQFNDFGLVAITRKRVKQSLERSLCMPCTYCEGSGTVKSVQTVIGEILAEAQKLSRAVDGKEVMLRVHPEVAKVLKSHKNQYLEELEGVFKKPVLVKGDASVHIEKYDLG